MTTGRVRVVSADQLGSPLLADAVAGATSLLVEFSADFDDDGGTLEVGGTQYVYTAVDEDTDTVTLAAGLSADAFEGDPVYVVENDAVAARWVAEVALDDPDAPDPVTALIPHALGPLLPEGQRGDEAGEQVVLSADVDGTWHIEDVINRTPVVSPLMIRQQTVAQSIPHLTWTGVALDTAIASHPDFTYTADGMVTVHRDGTYLLSASMRYFGNSTGRRYIRFLHSDGVTVLGTTVRTPGSAAANDSVSTIALPAPLLAGAAVTLQTLQDSGAALDTGPDAGGSRYVLFSVARMGD